MMAEAAEFRGNAPSGCIYTNYLGRALGGPMHKPNHWFTFNYAFTLLTLTAVCFWLTPAGTSLNDAWLGTPWH